MYFTVPELFEVSLCVRGAEQDAGWFVVNVEFLLNVGGDPTSVQGPLSPQLLFVPLLINL